MLSRLSLVICALVFFSSTARAGSSPSESSLARSFPPPPIRARAALVMDADRGTVLAAKEPHLRLPMASTTKIMTALLALQLGHLSDHLTVPRAAFDYESDATVMGLHPGQVVSLRDLMYGLLLPSGADAANTIAIHYAGSESRFVAMMNQKAVELGMRDTHYATPHGLPAPNQYSSAYDLALLGRYASRIPTLMKITSTRFYTWDGHVLTNVNHVLFWYPNVDGIKPGFTNDAGLCQVLDARRDGRHAVVAILNTPDLVIDARNLLNFGLQDFTWVQSSLPGDGPSLSQSGADADGPFLYFPGSGHDIHSGWLKTYLADGGLAALGFPRTEPLHESRSEVQYFQNGALSMDATSGRISRLALGLTPLPLPGVSPTPIPSPTPNSPPTSAPVTPVEHSIVLPDPGTATTRPTAAATRTPTPKPRPTARATPTPVPTPKAASQPATASVFIAFQRSHGALLGGPVTGLLKLRRYAVQIFAYGALAYDGTTHAIYLLPLGDRVLSLRGYLPAHPGNVYPGPFAPPSVLQAVDWLARPNPSSGDWRPQVGGRGPTETRRSSSRVRALLS